ncbi:MAG: hypothetical protein Q8N96_00760 [Methylovulum sp.]|nr:hypothetical protein [Methylovulum sp.]
MDECHLAARKATGQYRQLIAACQRYNPALRVIGLTGTPYRGDGIWLTEGTERLFTDIAARVTPPTAVTIREGGEWPKLVRSC